LTVKIY